RGAGTFAVYTRPRRRPDARAWLGYAELTGGTHGAYSLRRLRSHRAPAGRTPAQALRRPTDPDGGPGRGRVLRLSPGGAPHAGGAFDGAVAERLPLGGGPAHQAAALWSRRLCPASAPPPAADRGGVDAGPSVRRAAGAGGRARRGARGLLLGPG